MAKVVIPELRRRVVVLADSAAAYGISATWLAGMSWIIVALVSGTLVVFLMFSVFFFVHGVILGAVLVGFPLLFVSGMWGWRSATAALAGFAYSVGLAISEYVMSGRLDGLLMAIPGTLSVLAAYELNRQAGAPIRGSGDITGH